MDLDGKVAIVTGSSRGLGKAVAKTFARAGAKVTIAARTEEPHPRIGGTINQTAQEIQESGGMALPIKCNAASDDDIENMVKRTLAEFGRIDILVHPAAAISRGGLEETDLKRWDIVMGLNLRGLAALTKAVLPSMKTAGEGHIINVSPKITQVFGGPYGLSKQAATLLALSMAEEFKQYSIAVNTIWPADSKLRTEGMVAMKMAPRDGHDPQRFADAVATMVYRDTKSYTGNSVTDIEVLKEEGVTDLSKYDLPPLIYGKD